MQSGISASRELHEAFRTLISDASLRGLLAVIENESIVPKEKIPSTSPSFYADLSNLRAYLLPNEAVYIILRLDSAASTPTFAAVTYVPNSAPVRQKTLFASTRLTLVRELGSENFSDTLFTTEAEELTEQGWKQHEAHGKAENPLTEEERNLVGIKEAEATEVGGTARRGAGYGSSGVKIPRGQGVVEALGGLQENSLVMLKIDASETIVLAEEVQHPVNPSNLSSHISKEEPRYSFYRHKHSGNGEPHSPVIFIYTCPSSAKVKDRMLYASSRRSVEALASEAGIELSKKLEASDPSDFSAQTIEDEFAPKQEQKSGFAKPKRPGRR